MIQETSVIVVIENCIEKTYVVQQVVRWRSFMHFFASLMLYKEAKMTNALSWIEYDKINYGCLSPEHTIKKG